jgi:hypothetical protein
MGMKYNNQRYSKYKKSWINTSVIKYTLGISDKVKLEIKSLKDLDYKYRVNQLISYAVRNPKSDFITNYRLFSGVKFNRPEATHRRSEYDDEGYQVWSKDIDDNNRLIYRIYEYLKIILIVSISGHDLDKSKISTRLQSETDVESEENRFTRVYLKGQIVR